MKFKLNPGFQEAFVNSPADVTVGGGKAGVGKSFALAIDPLQWIFDYSLDIDRAKIRGVYFRRTMPEITQGGGLWDEAKSIYEHTDCHLSDGRYRATFDNGARLEFTHLQYEKDAYRHKGGQYTFIYFDELTSFLRSQFIYLLSRNRSKAGVPETIKATTNPQGFGWVKELVSWYIYPDNHPNENLAGYPRPDRIGKLRYFIAFEGDFIWGDSYEEVADIAPEDAIDWDLPLEDQILSFTFIPGDLEENIHQDASYRARLMAQSEEDKLRLLGGCWKAYDTPESLFYASSIEDLKTNTFVNPGNRYLTADIAFEGSDKFVIFVWEGWRVIRVFSYDKTDGEEIVDIIRATAEEFGIPVSNICYDAAGVGNYLRGYLKTAIAYNANFAPWPMKGTKTKPNYYKIRDQVTYMMANRMNNAGGKTKSGIYLPDNAFVNVDDRDRFKQELRAVHRKPNGTGPLRISTKDEIKARIGGSPDFLEAYVPRACFELERPKPGIKKKVRSRKKGRSG